MTIENTPCPGTLQVRGLRKAFGSFPVLSDISFTTIGGEILGLIGPNGAGKSTLLECITGLIPVDAGRVCWNNRPLASSRRKEVIWYQPDEILVFGQQRLRYTLSFFSRTFQATQDRLRRLVKELELAPMLDKPLQTLSKGYRRRAYLALALLSPQPLLLLDEPFDGFDIKQSLAVMDLLRRYRGQRTMILSIHQLSEAERICDRFILLGQGSILALGTLDQLGEQAGLPGGASLEEVFLALA